ncbi:phospholipase D-like domain-containing protein [Lelliottia wanjuensis]|nr:phospholipase D-like domain-containing protein [Lelliottia sp. V89_5]
MSGDFFQHLAIAFEKSSSVNILSPYLTMPAVEFLFKHLPVGVDVKLIVRARPQDILSGAVDINAINVLHESGVKCFFHRTLHGKFYQINENEGYIGSANFTSNGLCLNGYGNLELTHKVTLTSEDKLLIASVFDDSLFVTSQIIKKILEYSKNNKMNVIQSFPSWWGDIIPNVNYIPIKDGIYVGDLPWCNLLYENEDKDIAHDKDVFLYGQSFEKMRCEFLQSKVYHYFCAMINHREYKEMYFGELTESLQNGLKDDSIPYRKDIKGYVINLLSYFERLVPDIVCIDRPNYSQRVSLKNLRAIK